MCRAVALVVVFGALGARVSFAWQTAVSATPPDARPAAVAVDAAGDVIAVGRTIGLALDEDALVVKLSADHGIELWQRQVAGSGLADDVYRAVAVDETDLVAVGRVKSATAEGDALVSRYTADGARSWQLALDGGASFEDDAFGVAIDAAGDVLVAGNSTPIDSTRIAFTVWKRLRMDGSPLWQAMLVGDNGTARAVAIEGPDVVAAGDVAAGDTMAGDDRRFIAVARFDGATGEELWRADVAGSAKAADVGRVLATGGGRVVVGGRVVSAAGDPDFALYVFDASNGDELWHVILDGTATGENDQDDVFGVAVDASGDVLAVGRLSDAATDDDGVAIKLAGATGKELWRTVVNGGNDNADVFQALALDVAGDLMIAGTLRNRATRADLLVLKLANATGVESWRRTIDGSQHMADTGLAVAVGPGDDLIVAGRLRNGDTDDGFVIARRVGANGGDYPCGDGAPDPGEACDDGNGDAGDGCRADCTVEVCGDAIPDPQEQCDDGNAVAGDCCSDHCMIEPDGTACNDADACTLLDACKAGVCTPSSRVACTPLSPCHLAICDPSNGSCSSPPKAEGAPCSDGDACTILDQCFSGVCTGTTAVQCNDDEPCTHDSCAPAVGCLFTPLQSFESISCTFQRTTIAGACGGPLPRPIDRKIRAAKGLIAKASLTQRAEAVRRMLKVAMRNLEKATRLATGRRHRARLVSGCAEAVEAELGDWIARVRNVRDGL